MDVEEQGRRKNPTPRVNTEDDWVCVAQYILPTTVCSTERLRKLQIDLLSVTTYLTWHDKQQRRAPHSHLVATFSPCPSSIHLCCCCFRRRLFPGMTQFLPEHVRPLRPFLAANNQAIRYQSNPPNQPPYTHSNPKPEIPQDLQWRRPNALPADPSSVETFSSTDSWKSDDDGQRNDATGR